MGGKVWSKLEEKIFWTILAVRFPPGLHQVTKDVKQSHKDLLKSWAPFPKLMEDLWYQHNPGKEPPRNYTAVSMYEHYFQNFVQKKLSPNAKPYVDQYNAWLQNQAENLASGSDSEASESREPSAPEESSDDHDHASYDHGSQERPSKRLRMTSEGCYDSNMSAAPVLAKQNCMLVQHPSVYGALPGSNSSLAYLNLGGAKRFAVRTPNGSTVFPLPIRMNQASVNHNFSRFSGQNIGGCSQIPPAMPDMQDPPLNNWGQGNMGAACPELITGHHGAQNDANFSMHQNAVQPDDSAFTGSGGAQKRKRSDYE